MTSASDTPTRSEQLLIAIRQIFQSAPIHEVRNQYDGDIANSWYLVILPKGGLLIGPRKRVFAVQGYAARSLDATAIIALGKELNVTAFARKPAANVVIDELTDVTDEERALLHRHNPTGIIYNYSEYTDGPAAGEFEVHAWDRPQLHRFLRLALELMSAPEDLQEAAVV